MDKTQMAETMGLAEVAEFYRGVLAGKSAGLVVSLIPELWLKEFKCPLPLKRLGFSKVAQMLHAMPHVAKVVTQGSSCMVYPAGDAAGVNPSVTSNQPADPVTSIQQGDSAESPCYSAHQPAELAAGETTKHVREWLLARVQKAGDQGLVASLIPTFWSQDYPSAGVFPLKQMGVNKLIKFLLACSDIVRTARPTDRNGTVSVTELLVFPADSVAQTLATSSLLALPPPPPGGGSASDAGAPPLDPSLVVKQEEYGSQTWIKASPTDKPEPGLQGQASSEVQASEAREGALGEALPQRVVTAPEREAATQRAAPGIERPAAQLRAEEIEERYGKGFAMLCKMGYAPDNAMLATRTPIAVIPKTEKRGLCAEGEDRGGAGGAVGKSKQLSETQGRDAVFIKEWLTSILRKELAELGGFQPLAVQPLAMSRIPDLWSQQFSGTFPVKTLGFKKLINLLQAFNDVVKLVIQGQTSIGVLPTDSVLEGWKREEAVQGPSKRARFDTAAAAPLLPAVQQQQQAAVASWAAFSAYADMSAAAASGSTVKAWEEEYVRSLGFASVADACAKAHPPAHPTSSHAHAALGLSAASAADLTAWNAGVAMLAAAQSHAYAPHPQQPHNNTQPALMDPAHFWPQAQAAQQPETSSYAHAQHTHTHAQAFPNWSASATNWPANAYAAVGMQSYVQPQGHGQEAYAYYPQGM